MIIDSSLIPNMGLASDRVIVQPGDGQLLVPPILTTTLDLITPLRVSGSSTDRTTTSRMAERIIARNNAGVGGLALIVITKGLYTIEYNIGVRFNYTGANGNQDGVLLELVYQGFTMSLLNIVAFVGSFSEQGSKRFLLDSEASLQITVGATGVGDFIDGHCGVNVIRHM